MSEHLNKIAPGRWFLEAVHESQNDLWNEALLQGLRVHGRPKVLGELARHLFGEADGEPTRFERGLPWAGPARSTLATELGIKVRKTYWLNGRWSDSMIEACYKKHNPELVRLRGSKWSK